MQELKAISQSSIKRIKQHDNMVLFAKKKKKLSTIEVLTSKALIDSYVNHDEFDNVLREYSEMKEEIKNPENAVEYTM